MIKIDGKRSMIEKTVQDYAECGIDKFVVLTGFFGLKRLRSILLMGPGGGLISGIHKILKEERWGMLGAILHALNNGVIDDTLTSIVHNPDDVILGLERSYGEVFLEGHLKGRKNGCIATFVVVPQTPFQYSGLIINQGKVQDISKYPPVAIPAHTGITVFDPEVYKHFRKLVSLEVESSFENVICSTLVREGRLFAINIPSGTWIPINDLKGLEKTKSVLREG